MTPQNALRRFKVQSGRNDQWTDYMVDADGEAILFPSRLEAQQQLDAEIAAIEAMTAPDDFWRSLSFRIVEADHG